MQDIFLPIQAPGYISCAGVTRSWHITCRVHVTLMSVLEDVSWLYICIRECVFNIYVYVCVHVHCGYCTDGMNRVIWEEVDWETLAISEHRDIDIRGKVQCIYV